MTYMLKIFDPNSFALALSIPESPLQFMDYLTGSFLCPLETPSPASTHSLSYRWVTLCFLSLAIFSHWHSASSPGVTSPLSWTTEVYNLPCKRKRSLNGTVSNVHLNYLILFSVAIRVSGLNGQVLPFTYAFYLYFSFSLLMLLFPSHRTSSASSGLGIFSFRPSLNDGDSGHTQVLTPNNSGK